MTYAIKAENLGKCYLIGHRKKEAYSTLRDTLAHGVQNIWQRLRHPNIPAQDNQIEEFWALKDVSFEIQPGDRVGIIGRNGAGKSTLLKVLSRITEPSTGKFITRGRVASLLEVGTGFHPELTGRENIYLNGSILGMTRADVKRQFDAIVDFSGVEKFLDTPVKRYSSGMYVRLAFAVAAHLDPDILIVDEVLAVGDTEFQKKCLGKMEEVGKEGRTVVFVSHNMGAVKHFCSTTLVLEQGTIHAFSKSSAEGIANFQKLLFKQIKPRTLERANHYDVFSLINFSFANQNNSFPSFSYTCADLPVLEIKFNLHSLDSAFNIGIAVYSESGDLLFWSNSTDSSEHDWPRLQIGENTYNVKLPNHFLNEGIYQIRLMASLHFRKWILNPESTPHILTLHLEGQLSDSPYWLQRRPGLCAPILKWSSLK